MRRFVLVSGLVLAACGDPTDPGSINRIRTVLFYREDTGENHLLNSDGTAERRVVLGATGLVPVGLSSAGSEVALLHGNALVIGNLNDPARVDTVLYPIPGSMSLVAFSPDDRYLALFQYAPDPRLLIVDRSGAIDSFTVGEQVPDLPPVFSPDGLRVALVTVTQISVIVTMVQREDGQLQGDPAGFSRFIYQPIFGWPRWTEDGLLLGTVREGGDGDTLMVMVVDPDEPTRLGRPLYGVPSPVLEYDTGSSYAFSADGQAVVLAALPSVTARRRLYYAVRGGRLTNLTTADLTARPAFPLLLP